MTPQRFQLALCILRPDADLLVESSRDLVHSSLGQYATKYQKKRSRAKRERERNTSRALINPSIDARLAV